MSFSQDVKNEILSRDMPKGCCAHAAAYAVACFGKYFDARGTVLHTESQACAEHAQRLLRGAGLRGEITLRGKERKRRYELAVKDAQEIKKLPDLFGHTGNEPALRINSANFVCEHCVSAFTATAFLCCGTVTNPEKEYNLEFISPRYSLMRDFAALLRGHGFTPRQTQRKGANVLYIKASEQIEDMLTYMGASGAAISVMNAKIYKDIRNKANRITNCETANIDKTVMANQSVLSAIAVLRAHGVFETLPQPLREAAELREQMPDETLKTVAEHFHPPISKSGLAHRFKKLEQLAEQCRERSAHV